MAKKEVTNTEAVEKDAPVVETKENVDNDFHGESTTEGLVVGAGENDTAIEQSKGISTADAKPKEDIEDSEESSKVIEQDNAVKEAVTNGEVAGFTASQMSVLQKPMVPNPTGNNRPVYETAEQAHLALAAAGKLGTPGPEELPKD